MPLSILNSVKRLPERSSVVTLKPLSGKIYINALQQAHWGFLTMRISGEVPSDKAANGAVSIGLDASINSCRRLSETLFLITYPISTSFGAINAQSEHIHSMVVPNCFKGQELQGLNMN